MLPVLLAVNLGINWVSSDSCYRTLTNTVEQIAADIRITLECKEKQMQVIANMLADHTTLNDETCQRYLGSLPPGKLVSSFSILLPDNWIIYGGRVPKQADSVWDHKTESEKTYYLSDVFEAADEEKYVAYVFPIEREQEILFVTTFRVF